jgi:ubiquinone/menaquinone biosynthesis C-methylase UbiE
MAEPVSRSHAFAHLTIPQAYDAYLAPAVFGPWAQLLVDHVGVQPGAHVLDVATGTGVVAAVASARVGEQGDVMGADISPAMLAVAAAKPVPVRWLTCSADALPLPDASQDIVLCQHGLQFFPDKLAALREMRRVVRPSGRLGLAVWASERPFGLYGPMIAALARRSAEPYPHAFDGRSYTMAADEVRGLVEEAGFRAVEVLQRTVTATWASMEEALATIGATTFGPVVAALSAEQQAALREELRATLGQRTPEGGLACATHGHVVRATAE